VVEIGAFLVTLCLLFFVPVSFRVYYRKSGADDLLILEMTMLHGLLKRRKVTSLINPNPRKQEKTSGRLFFFQRKQVKEVNSQASIKSFQTNSRGLREFWWRYRNYGLGVTLLTYFLPAKYRRWLLVIEDLEKKGWFDRFIWVTHFGTGDAAQTAVIHGIVSGITHGLTGYLRSKFRFNQKPVLEVIPDYQQPKWDMLIDCIFRVKLGYIIIMALIARFRERIRHRLLKGGVWIEQSSN
jgi:hypothetical protein